jgi:hypothetical protein
MKAARLTYVFLGPSLPADEARALCPDAIVLPPAAVGDVHRLVRDHAPARGALRVALRVALIDGYFERMAAVWHKELLDALAARVDVHGAASMGALRAAELHEFGMRGHGAVFAAYRAGRLTDDDEVAVAHLPASHGYRPTSDALVNLRAGLGLARRRRVITAAAHDALLAAARARFYRDRSWAALQADARASRLAPVRALDALARLVAAEPARVDAKAADARALLRHLGRTPPRRPPRPRWVMSRTWFWERFTEMVAET